jgi:hypothetical protein
VKNLFLSLMICCGIPYYEIICRLKMYARSYVMAFSLYSMKYPYFVSLSITIKIKSYLILILGLTEADNLVMKFIATFYYAPVGAVFAFSFS